MVEIKGRMMQVDLRCGCPLEKRSGRVCERFKSKDGEYMKATELREAG